MAVVLRFTQREVFMRAVNIMAVSAFFLAVMAVITITAATQEYGRVQEHERDVEGPA